MKTKHHQSDCLQVGSKVGPCAGWTRTHQVSAHFKMIHII